MPPTGIGASGPFGSTVSGKCHGDPWPAGIDFDITRRCTLVGPSTWIHTRRSVGKLIEPMNVGLLSTTSVPAASSWIRKRSEVGGMSATCVVSITYWNGRANTSRTSGNVRRASSDWGIANDSASDVEVPQLSGTRLAG